MPLSASPHLSAPDARGFGHVETWIFDLDNTLYPHEARVWPQVDERITLFLMQHFEIDGLSARALQKHYYHRYGTTLRGLMEEEGIDAAAFEPSRAAMFEDIAKNLVVPHDLGMTTCLVLPKSVDPFRDAFEQEVVQASYIDHTTTDLASFLSGPVCAIL
jgi:FMN phosphatase YigB (HAD superfamily)